MEKKLMAHEEKLSETKQKISANSQSVLLIGNTNDTIMARDENFFTSRLLTQVGYRYAISTSGNSDSSNGGDSVNMKMTLEQLLKTDPDVIILMTGKQMTSTPTLNARSKRMSFGKAEGSEKRACIPRGPCGMVFAPQCRRGECHFGRASKRDAGC